LDLKENPSPNPPEGRSQSKKISKLMKFVKWPTIKTYLLPYLSSRGWGENEKNTSTQNYDSFNL
jgi:hypothetical protein